MDINANRFSTPVVTGTPTAAPAARERQGAGAPGTAAETGKSFYEVLQAQRGLRFSKHAVNRVAQRELALSPNELARLKEGVRIADEKGLKDTLILIDRTAFIVNVKNNTVITAVHNTDLKGNVFTNIDGTVIM